MNTSAAKKLRSQISEYRAAEKKLVEVVEDREQQISSLIKLRKQKPLAPILRRKVVGAKQRRQGVPFLLCSDWHIEEKVESAKVLGLNEYNLDIADKCIAKMAEAFTWMSADRRFDCRTAVIALLGDLYSGYIHEELVEGNFLSPTQAVLWLQVRIERMLRTIAANNPNLERIVVVCNDGNHGRLTHKIRVATRTANSLEWLLYQNLAVRMSDDKRFEFTIAEGEWATVDVFDKVYAFTHGDHFRYAGGVGGLLIPVRRGLNEMRKYRKFDHVAMGHFHQRHDLESLSVNGSMIGVNAYSMHIHATPEPRQQSWFMVDSERGKCVSAPVWL